MEKYIAEFVGTLVLVALNNGVVANVLLKKTKANGEGWILITFAAGMAVTMGIYVAMIQSDAHINPAVSIAMFAVGQSSLLHVTGNVVAQMLGGMTGALLVYFAYYQHYQASSNPDHVLATFSTNSQIKHKGWNTLTEVIATMFLVFGVLVLTSEQLTIPSYLIPIIIGALVMLLGVSLGGSTGFAMNPARDLGPRITHSLLRLGPSNWRYAWIPVVGPMIGGTAGAILGLLYLGGL